MLNRGFIVRFSCVFSCVLVLSIFSGSAWAGNCCVADHQPGCEAPECEDCVIYVRSSCQFEWDSICVNIARYPGPPGYCTDVCPCGTVVQLTEFIASASKGGITLQWRTASEVDNAGFHLWRSDAQDGVYSKITTALIPAKGGPTLGAEYEHRDTDVKPGRTYYYKLEDIDDQGLSTFHGPVSATVEALAVPTLSQWGAIVLSLSLGTGAVLALRRRRMGLMIGD